MFNNVFMKRTSKSNLTWLNMTVMVLSLYIVIVLLLDMFFDLDDRISRLIEITDFAICIFFFVEFLFKLFTATNKLEYLKWGWLDLISSIPMIDSFRYARIFRIIQFVRIIRSLKGLRSFLSHFYDNKAKGTFYSVAIIALLVVMIGSIAILQVENHSDSNIKNASDALWWSFVTMMTVGYGDKYPVTDEGRIVGVFVMTVGVVLVSTMAGFVASWFLDSSNKKSD